MKSFFDKLDKGFAFVPAKRLVEFLSKKMEMKKVASHREASQTQIFSRRFFQTDCLRLYFLQKMFTYNEK